MAVPEKFRDIVGAGAAAAGALGVPGAFAFGADVPVLMGIWATGALMISKRAGFQTSEEQVKGLVTSSLGGLALYLTGAKLASKLFHLLPGPGTLAAIGVNSSLNALFTYRFLRSVAKVYDDFDNEEINFQIAINTLTDLLPWVILDDIHDMYRCMSEGKELVECFK